MNEKLRRRLANWGVWLNHEAGIGPNGARCTSIESRHIPDSGDVWDGETPEPQPDVADAESLHALVRLLDPAEQYALAVRWGGTPCVMRWRRMSSAVGDHLADNAQTLLAEMIKKSA